MTWIASLVAMRRPELKDKFLPIAEHGIEFLSNVLWDKKYSGFFWGVGDQGEITDFYTDGKELYGESFAIFGAAAAYQATHNPRALALALRTVFTGSMSTRMMQRTAAISSG
jgi:mannobiose 2-epimerase